MIRLLSKLGVEVYAVEQPIDISIPEQKVMLAIYLATPEIENDRRAMNTIAGRRRALKEGRWQARPLKGYEMQSVPNEKSVMVIGREADFIKQAFDCVSKGTTNVDGILKSLKLKGFNCSKSQFHRMLRNVGYMGKVLIPPYKDEPEEIVNGMHEPLVTENTFYKVQEILNLPHRIRRKMIHTSKVHQKFPLKKHLLCPTCGAKVTASSSKGRGGTYSYYHCAKVGHYRIRAEETNEAFVAHLSRIKIAPEIIELYHEIMIDLFRDKERKRRSDLSSIESQLNKVEQQLLKIDQYYVAGNINKDSYTRLKKAGEYQKIQLQQKKVETAIFEENIENYLSGGITILSDMDVRYKEASFEGKHRLVSSIFPEKLTLTAGTFRTSRKNSVLSLLTNFYRGSGKKKNKQVAISDDLSHWMTPTGFEPVLPP